MSVGGKPVTVADRQREPHLVLHSQEARVVGYGGCNRMTSTYKSDGDRLSFGPIASTRMACAESMETEGEFHKALEKVARWRIVGESLELSDDTGASVARFEPRYMK